MAVVQDIVSRTLPEIAYSGGNKTLSTIEEISVDQNHADVKPVKTLNKDNRAIGYTEGVPDFSADLKVRLTIPREVDWDALFASGERFLITYDDGNKGLRMSLVNCRVTNIGKPFSQAGDMMCTVKVLALDHRPDNN